MNLDNIMLNMINYFENQVNETKEAIIYCPELDMILWTYKVSKRLYLIYMTDKHKEDIDVYDDDYYKIGKYLTTQGITP
jgi:hypothetical protein